MQDLMKYLFVGQIAHRSFSTDSGHIVTVANPDLACIIGESLRHPSGGPVQLVDDGRRLYVRKI